MEQGGAESPSQTETQFERKLGGEEMQRGEERTSSFGISAWPAVATLTVDPCSA